MDHEGVADCSYRFIHILLVHNDQEFVNETRQMLEQRCYRVTTAGLVHDALKLLQSGNKECIDLLMAHVDLPDIDEFSFLQTTKKMNLTTVLISSKTEMDGQLAARARKQGDLLYFRTPLSVDILNNLWQFVTRQKPEKPLQDDPQRSEKTEIKTTTAAEKKLTVTWTDELKRKFWDAVMELGEGNCVPKTIQDKMNVEGLTRLQVASFLQKARDKNKSADPSKEDLSKKRPRSNYFRSGSLPGTAAQSSTIITNSSENINETSEATEKTSVQTSTTEAPVSSSLPTNTHKGNEERHLKENPRRLATAAKEKLILKWTDELKKKFWDAVMELGEGNCFPAAIRKKMNVKGLTRLQVASFLQNVRNKNLSNPFNNLSNPLNDNLPKKRRINYNRNGSLPCTVEQSSILATDSSGNSHEISDQARENSSVTTKSIEAVTASSLPTNSLEANGSGDRVSVDHDNLSGENIIGEIQNVDIGIVNDHNTLFPNEVYFDSMNDDADWENLNLGLFSPNRVLSQDYFGDGELNQTYPFENSATQKESQEFLTDDAMNLWVDQIMEPVPSITNHDKVFDKKDEP